MSLSHLVLPPPFSRQIANFSLNGNLYLGKCVLGMPQAVIEVYSKQINNSYDDDGNLNTKI